jgi:predicted Zn-ribbon and HTH transcriptional regulator
MINITSVNLDKTWDYKNLTFNIISTVKYSIKILCEFRFCYVLIKMRIFPIYFFIDVLRNAYHLLKLIVKIYETYNNAYYVQTLPDYNIYMDLKNQGLLTPNLTKEEIDKLKKDKINLCNICLCEIEKGKYLNCGHIYHLKCIKEWVSINSKCPICKSSIINENYNRNKFLNERFGINNNVNINHNNLILNNEREQQLGNFINEENIGLHKVKTNNIGGNKNSYYSNNYNSNRDLLNQINHNYNEKYNNDFL